MIAAKAYPYPLRGTRGFTLMEALILVMILAIVGASTGRALQSLVRSPENNDVQFQLDMAMVNEMESLRALAFDKLVVGTYTTGVTIYRNYYPMTIAIDFADAGRDAGPKPQLKSVTVTLAGRSMTTLVCKP